MMNPMKLAAIGIAAITIAACSGTSSSVINPVHAPGMTQMSTTHGTIDANVHSNYHVMLPKGAVSHDATCDGNPACDLTNFGGPLLTKPKVYVVFWHFGIKGQDPAGEKTYMTNFLKYVGGSPWESVLTQYGVTNPAGQLAGTWVDDTNAEPAHPSDAQIQTEAGKLMAHFTFNADASYVVATSHGHGSPGFGSSYCAYHGATTQGGHTISYTNMPYIHDAGANCGENFVNGGTAGKLDGVSIVEGHEYAESITDPQPPTAWYNSTYGEIGDICAWQTPPAGNIVLNGKNYAVQGLWSNNTTKCSILGGP